MRLRPLFLAVTVAGACAPRDGENSTSGTTPGVTSVSVGTTGSSTGSTDAGSSGGGGGSGTSTTTGELSTTSTGSEGGSTTLILDVGSDIDVGDGKPVGCKGKIDFLFVISRAAGMEGFQTQLLDAFPKFIDTIEEKFSDFNYHIMVVDADPYWGLSYCDEQCPTPGEAPCTLTDYPCDYTPTKCDTTMGAGVVFPAADDATNKLCPIDGGRRYMAKGQTDLKETFACTAQVGSSGDDNIGEALAYAVQPWMNEPGACNDGFLRDDALLMVTLISNTYDTDIDSEGTPDTWTAEVRKAKHDDLESVVLLNIGDTMVPGCHDHDRLCQMVKLFPYALNKEIWANDYGPFFEQATNLVTKACAEFIPG